MLVGSPVLAIWVMPPLEVSCTRATCPPPNEIASLIEAASNAIPCALPHEKGRLPCGLERPFPVYVSRTRLLEPPLLVVGTNPSSVRLPHPLHAISTSSATTGFVVETVPKFVQSPSDAALTSRA